jgi:hypothetical protein
MAKEKDKTSLRDRIKKNSTLKHTAVLAESRFLSDKKEDILTEIPLINAALSGDMDIGMVPGILQIVGDSKMFKTGFLMLLLRSFLNKNPDGIGIYYDSEFGAPQSYFEAFGIDMNRVIHCPVSDVEMLTFDIMAQLEAHQDGDKIFIALDSLGNLASKREIENAIEKKSVQDMTRAKSINSMFRMVTPHLTLKSLYMVAINHGYQELALYPKTIVGGGKKSYLSSDNIWIIGREQERDKDKELIGHTFNVRIEKSRYAKEKLVIPVTVTFDGGIDRYSGLLEIAEDLGFIKRTQDKPKGYSRVDVKTGEIEDLITEEKASSTADFWNPLLNSKEFKDAIRKYFEVAHIDLLDNVEATDV